MTRPVRALAAVTVLAALAAGAAGCRGAGTSSVPAIFTPSPGPVSCPPGWHRYGDGCLITGTLQPGQQLSAPPVPGSSSGVAEQ